MELPVFFRRVLVLGADCDPGLSIVASLLAEGHKIVAWVRPGTPRQPWDEQFVEVVAAEWPAATEAMPALPQCDVVVLPNALEESDGPPEALWSISERRYRVAERAMRSCGAVRLVLVSSIEVTGPLLLEEGERFEAQEPRPVQHAGGALLAVELLAMQEARERRIELVILRAGHLYGHGTPGFFARAVDLLQSSGVEFIHQEWANHRYQPLHIEDLAHAVARSINAGNGIYHLAGPELPTVAELLRVFERAARSRGIAFEPLKPPLFSSPSPERIHYRFPADRARRELGFAPRWSTEAGLLEVAVHTGLDLKLASRATASHGSETKEDWSEDAGLAGALHAPVRAFLTNAVGSHGIRTVLDLGCGTGEHSVWMAKHLGVRVCGIDPVAELVVRANARAAAEGVADRAAYISGDLGSASVTEPVDAVCLFGALEEHPQILEKLRGIAARVLKPDGVLLLVGPHCIEGYHPRLSRVMHAFFGSWMRRFFDESAYRRAIARDRTRGFTALRRDGALGARRSAPLSVVAKARDERYAHFLAPFIANAFVTFQRAKLVRGVVRLLLPLIVRADGWLCRFPLPQSWAALSMRSYAARDLQA